MSLADEQDYIGMPIHLVPRADPGEYCNAKKKMREDGEIVRNEENHVLFAGYCNAESGKGTDHFGEGRCSDHGGSMQKAEAHNQRAAKHHQTSDPQHYHENLPREEKEFVENTTDAILGRVERSGREPDFLDRVLARRVAIDLHIASKASEYSRDELVQVIVHEDGGSHEEKGPLVEEVRRFSNSIFRNLDKLNVLPDASDDGSGDSMENWREFVENNDDAEVVVEVESEQVEEE